MPNWLFNKSISEWILVLLGVGAVLDAAVRLYALKTNNQISDLNSRLSLCKEQKESAENERDVAQKQVSDITLELEKALLNRDAALEERDTAVQERDALVASIQTRASAYKSAGSPPSWRDDFYRKQ